MYLSPKVYESGTRTSHPAHKISRVLRELAERRGSKFGFKVDVKGAHQLIPVSPQDWHLLACHSEKTKQVYINMTGTFGVAGAAYWWSRVATAAVRGAHHVLCLELASWLLLVVDDLAMLIPHGNIREVVRVMFSLSWKTLAGGENLRWVGRAEEGRRATRREGEEEERGQAEE